MWSQHGNRMEVDFSATRISVAAAMLLETSEKAGQAASRTRASCAFNERRAAG